MSEIKYFVINGSNLLGTFWETENLGNVFIVQNQIDLNNPLEIYKKTELGTEKCFDIDILEAFMEILDYNFKKKEQDEKSS